MNINRINTYDDPRFSETVLNQHGAFLVDDEPYEIEVISDFEAMVRGREEAVFPKLIEEFRFYTPHITRFLSDHGDVVAEFPREKVFELSIEDIQPSQFFVDEEKLAAVGTFIQKAEDIIIQVAPYQGSYLSLDGHTRLFYAVTKGWTNVRAVESHTDPCLYDFAEEARKRGVTSPQTMVLLPHADYVEKWDSFCDDFFAARGE